MKRFNEYVEYLNYNDIETLPVVSRVGFEEVTSLVDLKLQNVNVQDLMATHMIAIQSSPKVKDTTIEVDLYDSGIEVIKAFLTDFILKTEGSEIDTINLMLNINPLIVKLKELGDEDKVEECCNNIANNLNFVDSNLIDELRVIDLLESPDFRPYVYSLGEVVQSVYDKTYVNVFSVEDFDEEFNSNPNMYSLFIKELLVRTNLNDMKLNLGFSKAHTDILKIFNVKAVSKSTLPVCNGFNYEPKMSSILDIDKENLILYNIITYSDLKNYFRDKALKVVEYDEDLEHVNDIAIGECMKVALSLRQSYGAGIYEAVLKEF